MDLHINRNFIRIIIIHFFSLSRSYKITLRKLKAIYLALNLLITLISLPEEAARQIIIKD